MLLGIVFTGSARLAAQNIELHTPYTRISVPPGEKVSYTVKASNKGNTTQWANMFVTGLPSDWGRSLKAGGYAIEQLSILPGDSENLTLSIDVPGKVRKGAQRFAILAAGSDTLSLVIDVSEQGSYSTEFTSQQANLQGHADAEFSFSTKLDNRTGEKQSYSLTANAPRGWQVVFKPNYKQATAVEIEPNGSANVSIEVKPPYNVDAGTFAIPVRASNRVTSAELELEVDITASYQLELTTPTGLLSSKVTAGNGKQLELLVRNTGSGTLENIRFISSKPNDWEITIEPDTIRQLAPGASTNVMAMVKPADKAIPGDYAAKITARTNEVSSVASFRLSVKTPLLWGWIGILVILGIVVFIWWMFRKYGRR